VCSLREQEVASAALPAADYLARTTRCVHETLMCNRQRAYGDTLQMVALIGAEVNMALPTTALFDYPSPEALAYFIASAQVHINYVQPNQHCALLCTHNFAFKVPTACLAASQHVLFAWHTVCHLLQTCALAVR
jgi:hypothetical protein